MIDGILNGVPTWVWFLFVFLLILGLIDTRARKSPLHVFYLLPLLGAMSLRAVNALDVVFAVWGVVLLVYVFGAWVGFRVQKKWIVAKSRMFVSLKGEWLTLVQIMSIFAINFATGTLKAVSPELLTSTTYHIIFAAIAAMVAGLFGGRTLSVALAPTTEQDEVHQVAFGL